MQTLRQDLLLTFRLWGKSPLFVLAALLTLTLGIGANTALFTMADGVLARQLPVRDAGQLVVVRSYDADGASESFSYPMYKQLRDRTKTLEGLVTRGGMDFNVSTSTGANLVYGEFVSGNYYDVLGVQPYLGRLLHASDDVTEGAHPVAVISYGLWQRAFGADPTVPGREILLNGRKMTVVGVTPPGFYGTEMSADPAIQVPMQMVPLFRRGPNALVSPRHMWITMLGRLQPGISRERAQGELDALAHGIFEEQAAALPGDAGARLLHNAGQWRIAVEPGAQGFGRMQRMMRLPMWMLLGVTALVLLITCVNLANLLIARALYRRREVAVRIALGASRARLVRQFLTEAAALALAGGICGLLLASWLLPLLLRFLPEGTALQVALHPDMRAALFTLAVSVVTAVLFGLAPALQASRSTVMPALKVDSGAAGAGLSSLGMRNVLIVSQVALSVMLLAGAGLFLRTLQNLRGIDTGFQRQQVLMATINPRLSGYDTARTAALARDLEERVRSIPGVVEAGISELNVLSGSWDINSIIVEGRPPDEADKEGPQFSTASPAYFRAMQLPLLAGRGFTDADTASAPKVAVISESMARHYFPDGNAIGRKFAFAHPDAKPDIEIVGVTKDSRYVDLREKAARFVYLPLAQAEPDSLTLYVRSSADPLSRVPMVRDALRSLDPNLAMLNVKTVEAQLDDSIVKERGMAYITACFGVLATVLAIVGLYGVLAFSVARRTREIGIRLALGARRGDVLGLVFKQTAILLGLGIAAGLAGAAALARLIAGALYGVAPTDPASLGLAAVVLLMAAFLAAWLPARRAAGVDPLTALRQE
jgi:predicted permease